MDVTLPTEENTPYSKDTHTCIDKNMDNLDQGRFVALVGDTVMAGRGEEYYLYRVDPWRNMRIIHRKPTDFIRPEY